MASPDLMEILNDCIDRLNAGEGIENCIADHPEYANTLRQLLETGQLVHRARYSRVEVADEQAQVRTRVVRAMRHKAQIERENRMKRRNWFIPLTAVASIVFVLGLAAIVFLSSSEHAAIIDFETTSTAVVALNITQEAYLRATIEAGGRVTALPDMRSTMVVGEPTLMPAITLPPISVGGLTATPMNVMYFTPTAIPSPTPTHMPGTILPTAIPSATPAHVINVETAVSLSATAIAGYYAETPAPEESGVGGASTALPATGGSDLVPTSVLLMSPVPSSHEMTEVAYVPTSTATMTPLPSMTAMPTMVMSPDVSMLTATMSSNMNNAQNPPPTPTPIPMVPQIIPLQAGEIDDNARWDNYLTYRNNFLERFRQQIHDVDVSGRQIITVMNEQGLPVLGARIQVFAGQTLVSESRTYATGKTLFFPNARAESRNAQSFHVVVEKDNASAEFTLDPNRGPNWNVTLTNVPELQTIQLDVLFLLDATGSMADEIMQLQNNILNISSQIHALPGNIDVRYGLVTYRDRGDAYVTRINDFVPDVTVFQTSLNQVQADGGGDTPESVNEALHNAVQGVNWRGDDTVKLIFLVADAPPHLDYSNDYDYAEEMVIAAQKGIKIHPVASSGLDQTGEFIFRQIAQYTMGHFIFLTYEQGGSGAPGESRDDLHVGEPDKPEEQKQGDYTVEQLDELVLQLIKDELAALQQRVEVKAGVDVRLPLGGGFGEPSLMLSTLVSVFNPKNTGGVSLPFVMIIIVLSVWLGYSLHTRTGEGEKRKNDTRAKKIVPIAIESAEQDRVWPE